MNLNRYLVTELKFSLNPKSLSNIHYFHSRSYSFESFHYGQSVSTRSPRHVSKSGKCLYIRTKELCTDKLSLFLSVDQKVS